MTDITITSPWLAPCFRFSTYQLFRKPVDVEISPQSSTNQLLKNSKARNRLCSSINEAYSILCVHTNEVTAYSLAKPVFCSLAEKCHLLHKLLTIFPFNFNTVSSFMTKSLSLSQQRYLLCRVQPWLKQVNFHTSHTVTKHMSSPHFGFICTMPQGIFRCLPLT